MFFLQTGAPKLQDALVYFLREKEKRGITEVKFMGDGEEGYTSFKIYQFTKFYQVQDILNFKV